MIHHSNKTLKLAKIFAMTVGILGGGAMGSGIAQVAAMAGHKVTLVDLSTSVLQKALLSIQSQLEKGIEKGKITSQEKEQILERISVAVEISSLVGCDLVIEAIIEKLEVKQKVFAELDALLPPATILASNTSSLSITAIASACQYPDRVVGLHFFNPANLMPLVEIIPAIQTRVEIPALLKEWMLAWKKVPVITKDTPGFIVNRVARPFYSEALRILEEGIATKEEIDFSMKQLGFKMGPFELMDMIGHDVNYAVTESVFTAFYFDPRFKPSLTQKKLVEAGWLGKKTGRGFYAYPEGPSLTDVSSTLQNKIQNRILAMLINEAYDAHYLCLASEEDIDLAMTKGVNYPKGLIAWGKEWGLAQVALTLEGLYQAYQEDRYRLSVGLKNRITG
jgi:3-hydroxybutyryl-CoA dehydrogenase